MSAIAKFNGPKAEELLTEFLELLPDGTHTVILNGRTFAMEVKNGKPVGSKEITSVELPSYFQNQPDVLAKFTSGKGDDVFASSIEVNKTHGSKHGKVY